MCPAALSPFSYVAPADLVLFLGITVLLLSSGVVESRRLGLMNRLAAAPVRRRSVVAALIATSLCVAAVQCVGLLVVGRLHLRRALGRPRRRVPRPRHAVARLCRRGRAREHALAHRGAGDLPGGRARHRVRDAGRVHVPARRGGPGGPGRRPRGAPGLGHGRVHQADLRPRRADRGAAGDRGARRSLRPCCARWRCGPTRGRCTRRGESAGSAGGTSRCGPATASCCGPGGRDTSCRTRPRPTPSAPAGPAGARCSAAARPA